MKDGRGAPERVRDPGGSFVRPTPGDAGCRSLPPLAFRRVFSFTWRVSFVVMLCLFPVPDRSGAPAYLLFPARDGYNLETEVADDVEEGAERCIR